MVKILIGLIILIHNNGKDSDWTYNPSDATFTNKLPTATGSHGEDEQDVGTNPLSKHVVVQPPLSKDEIEETLSTSLADKILATITALGLLIVGAGIGALVGLAVGGPVGIFVGGVAGGAFVMGGFGSVFCCPTHQKETEPTA